MYKLDTIIEVTVKQCFWSSMSSVRGLIEMVLRFNRSISEGTKVTLVSKATS